MWIFASYTKGYRTTATAIDYFVTDAILESTMHCGIIKANISDDFPIFAILKNSCNKKKLRKKQNNQAIFQYWKH